MVGSLSGVIQSQALSALFLPVVSRVSARTGMPLKRLLLPMACMILCGTNITMISNSPLILLNDLIASANRNLPPGAQTIEPFSLFAVAPIGIPLLLAGLAYFAFFSRRLLPSDEDRQKVTPGRTETYFAETYGIDGDVVELIVTTDSPLVGMSVGEVEQLRGAPLILALKTGNEARLAPPGDQMIWVGSVLGVLGKREAINEFANTQLCQVQTRLRNFADLFNPTRAGISEAVIPPNSRWVKKSRGDLRLRKTSASRCSQSNAVTRCREDVRHVRWAPGPLVCPGLGDPATGNRDSSGPDSAESKPADGRATLGSRAGVRIA